MLRVIYAATPFRMQHLRDKICDFIESYGHFPLHPLLALPHERFNYRRHDRETIYRICLGLVNLSDELWIFGVGGGSLKEWQHAKDLGKVVQSFVKVFDPSWEGYYRKYLMKKPLYKDVLEEVVRSSALPK